MSPERHKLRPTRRSITHRFCINNHEGYLTVGLYEDGPPGELFITMSKEGSTVGGLMDGIGIFTSLALQHGTPLETLVKKFKNTRFEPMGRTENSEIQETTSVLDYIFRWMELEFTSKSEKIEFRSTVKDIVDGATGDGGGESAQPKGIIK